MRQERNSRVGERVQVCQEWEIYEVVRGHFSTEDFWAILRDSCVGPEFGDDLNEPIHAWARWTPDSSGDYDMLLWWTAPGPGAFAVTVAVGR